MNAYEIVVATDGSEPAKAAVIWAAREAQRTDSVLHVVHAYDWNWPGARFDGGEEFLSMAETAAEQVVADARLSAHEVTPDLPVRRTAEVGTPEAVILRAAESARMVVVGSRGRGGFASLLLGSVGHRVAAHATCPVVVVRGRTDAADGPVIVGADGSAAGTHAVDLAFAAAAARGAELIAIRAFSPPVPPWGADIAPLVYDPAELEATERQALAELLAVAGQVPARPGGRAGHQAQRRPGPGRRLAHRPTRRGGQPRLGGVQPHGPRFGDRTAAARRRLPGPDRPPVTGGVGHDGDLATRVAHERDTRVPLRRSSPTLATPAARSGTGNASTTTKPCPATNAPARRHPRTHVGAPARGRLP